MNERFTLNTDSIDRYYQITDEETGNIFDVYKLSMCEELCELLNNLHTKNKQSQEEYNELKLKFDAHLSLIRKRDYTSQNQLKKLEAENHHLKEVLESCKRLNKRITTNCENFAEQVEKELIK